MMHVYVLRDPSPYPNRVRMMTTTMYACRRLWCAAATTTTAYCAATVRTHISGCTINKKGCQHLVVCERGICMSTSIGAFALFICSCCFSTKSFVDNMTVLMLFICNKRLRHSVRITFINARSILYRTDTFSLFANSNILVWPIIISQQALFSTTIFLYTSCSTHPNNTHTESY